jgi:uncharacterized cupin superfamily protein
MAESSFLAGKVVKRSLAVIEGTPGTGAPALKRLFLPQGELAQFYDGDEGIRYLAFIELRPGSIRGNHYHNVKKEFLYIIRGEVELVVQDIASQARAAIPLQTGDLAFIQTGIAHALRIIQPGQAIEFAAAPFDPVDIQRVTLV